MRIPPQLSCVHRGLPFGFVLTYMYCTTSVYFGAVMHVCGGEGLACKVGNPTTELVVTCRYEASIFAVEGVVDVKCCAISIAMVR